MENPGYKTSNGAGSHNIQMFFLTPDGTVLQCMPGYWTSKDLALIINDLVEPLNKIWNTWNYSKSKKNKLFAEAQLAFLNKHKTDFAKRSRMQGFDAAFEVKKRLDTTDCVHRDENGDPIVMAPRKRKKKANAKKAKKKRYKMKNTLEISLERMAKRPFIPYESFDVAKFSDIGRKQYDKKQDGGGEERMGMTKKRNKKNRKNKRNKKRRRKEATPEE